MTAISDAKKEGFQAYKCGTPVEANPYDLTTNRRCYDNWDYGWFDAEDWALAVQDLSPTTTKGTK